jgi:hypothetical protein
MFVHRLQFQFSELSVMAMFDDRNGPMDLGLTVKEPRHPVRSK